MNTEQYATLDESMVGVFSVFFLFCFFNKVNNVFPYDPSMALTVTQNYLKTTFRTKCACKYLATLFISAPNYKKPICHSISEWDKLTMLHPYSEILFIGKKAQPIKLQKNTWINLECLFLSARSQSERL